MPHHKRTYEFGPYQLDLTKRVLTREGESISLPPKATEILIILVSNAGQLVEKDELLKRVWPDTFVEESNLTQNIFTLRKVLRDERSGPRFIETVARRGYRFIASVRVVETGKRCLDFRLTDEAEQPIIAVLPFLNTTENSELEYLADGVTDNLINSLARVSKLRVMSHSAVSRYKTTGIDPRQVGNELGATVVLMGKLNGRPYGLGAELVDASTGWQLWGDNFDLGSTDLLQVQDAITRELLAALKLELSGDEEKRVTARYTQDGEAYQAYLEGRYHWGSYTQNGIERAIGHFRRAIEIDPNYALAYAAIVDCYLRLATNYLPPEEDRPKSAIEYHETPLGSDEPSNRVKLRFEWDLKGAQRELNRANELQTDFPATHQWYAAYLESRRLYEESFVTPSHKEPSSAHLKRHSSKEKLPFQIASIELTRSEQVQVYCAIVREQIDAGNYEAACQLLRPWWKLGNWPTVDGLNQKSCADLLFTAGDLAGCVASTRQLPQGQRHGEELLNGSIALFEQLGFRRRAAEGRIELALCYFRQGLFDIGRSTLIRVLSQLSDQNDDLRSLTLIRLASLERNAGKIKDSLTRLTEATAIVDRAGPWVTGRCHLEMASTYMHLAISENEVRYFRNAKHFYLKALYEFRAVGNHRLSAIVENNLGFLFLHTKDFLEAELYLLRARRAFLWFADKIRCAQVNDSLAQLYCAQGKFEKAHTFIERAVHVMETGDEDAFLAEALRTQGLIYGKLDRHSEAKRVLEEAHRLAGRCGDVEGAGRALIVLIEEVGEMLDPDERQSLARRLQTLLITSEQPSVKRRAQKCLELITGTSTFK